MILAKASLRGSIGGGDSAYGYPDFSGYSLSKVSVERWLGKTEQVDKWSFCLIVANMATNRRNDE
jgi:hypothetical protein|tara:strand:+ start:17 stop:211 length:195 start_codon:yes stop_codon:yes gene_type:complete